MLDQNTAVVGDPVPLILRRWLQTLRPCFTAPSWEHVLGFRIWIPRGNRQKIIELVSSGTQAAFLDTLPLNYDDATRDIQEHNDGRGPVRTLIHARFSSELQNSRSIDQQIEVCREQAEREGWDVIDVFTDAAISGSAGIGKSQRPGLAAMLERVEQGDIEQVLVDTTSRLARNQADSHHIREELNYWGARLFTLGDGEIDRFKGAIKGLLDEQQRVELRHNVKRGQRDTVRQGRAPAGLAYGFRSANRIDPNGRPVRGLREVDPVKGAGHLSVLLVRHNDGRRP